MSKSVRLRTSDARTGRRKKTPISVSAGARKIQAARTCATSGCAWITAYSAV
jgi:hypothetical protein